MTERFAPKIVSSSDGGRIERVIVSAAAVELAPELLGWCLAVGIPIEDSRGQAIEVLVPYDLWADRSVADLRERGLIESSRGCSYSTSLLESALGHRIGGPEQTQ